MKKERPILFSTEMVNAIFNGDKTQTRRIINPQPVVGDNFWRWDGKKPKAKYNTGAVCVSGYNVLPSNDNAVLINQCPYGKIGDVLWVRETHKKIQGGFMYKANPMLIKKTQSLGPTITGDARWKPSIHMPKSACRLWLEIVNVRVQKLNDINDLDAKSEGINKMLGYYRDYNSKYSGLAAHIFMPKQSFISLWQKINGEESWSLNPWVWVITFKKIEKH